MRTLIIVASALSLSFGAGCDTARDQQEKANKAQAEADQKIAEANREANDQIKEAQATADKKTAEAQMGFSKLREDYRHDVNTKLAELDKKIADLEAKAKTEPAAKRAALDAKLTDIRTHRQAFVSEYGTLETASATTWDDAKRRIDKAWKDLEAVVDRA